MTEGRGTAPAPNRPQEAGRVVIQEIAAVAVILALVAIAFANVVFGGKSLTVSTNGNPLDYRFLPENYGPDLVPPEAWTRRNLVTSPNYRDPAAAALQMEPAGELLHRSLARGQFPFWDPFTGGGTPLFASLVPAFLFPPALLVALLGNGTALRDAYLLLLIAGSGILTYRLLRGRGLSWEASLMGGAAFALSGAMVQTAPLGLGQPVAFFSLPLLATARVCELPSRRRAAEFAIAAAFVALASFPPMLAQVFGTCVAYLLAAVVFGPATQRAAAVGWFSAGVAMALAMVSVAYVPAFFAFGDSPQVARYYAHAAGDTLTRWHAFQLLSPTINGGASVYVDPPVAVRGQHLFYTGVVPLFLGIAGLLAPADPRARPLKIGVMVAGGLAMAKVFGWPIVHWIADVPLLRNVHYSSYFGVLGAYAICILAAFGVDAIRTARAKYVTLAIGGTAIAATLTALRLYAAGKQVELHGEGWRWIADFRLLVLFAVLAVVCAFLAVHRPRLRVVALVALLVVLGIEGVTNASFPRQRRWNVWEHPPPYVQAITERGTGGRVQPMPFYPANTQSVFGHSTMDSLTLLTSPRIFELYQRYFYSRITHFLIQTNQLPPERVLDAANVEYFPVMGHQSLLLEEARQRGYTTDFQDGLVRLMRRPTRPRYFFTSDYRVIPAPASLDALAETPTGTVVLDAQPSFEAVTGAPEPVRVVRFDLNTVEIVVIAPRAGLLYCSEARMPGWTATIDGRETPILAADYAFRAVEVPQGAHRVRFQYRPPGLITGLALSAVGLAAMLSCLLLPARQRRRESAT